MIRTLKAADVRVVADLAIHNDMFPEEARDFLEASAVEGLSEESLARWRVCTLDGAVVGVAFYRPKEATDRVWDLTMLAVAPQMHGRGVGRALLEAVENELRQEGQRLLFIETSATDAYTRTRAFYSRCGYAEMARVPDYFEDGDDLVLFGKDLRRESP